MDTLKICISRVVSGFAQSLKSSLHQGAYTAAENCLLTEQVCFGLSSEGCLQKTSSCSADSKAVSQCSVQSFSGVILLNSNQARSSFASLILASYCVARCFRSDHSYIYVLRRYDLSEVDSETMSEHQHVALFQVWLDIFFVHCSLFLIVDQDHNDISLFCSLSSGIYFESLCLCFCPGFAAFIKSNNNITAGIFQVQCMSMSLASVADNCDFFAFQ